MQTGIHACLLMSIRASARLQVQSRAPPEGPTAGRPCGIGTTPSTLGVHHRIVRSVRQTGKSWGPQSILATTKTTRFLVCTKLLPMLGSRVHAPPVSPLPSFAHRALVCLDCSDRDTYLDSVFVRLSFLSPERPTCRLFSWNGAQGSWL